MRRIVLSSLVTSLVCAAVGCAKGVQQADSLSTSRYSFSTKAKNPSGLVVCDSGEVNPPSAPNGLRSVRYELQFKPQDLEHAAGIQATVLAVFGDGETLRIPFHLSSRGSSPVTLEGKRAVKYEFVLLEPQEVAGSDLFDLTEKLRGSRAGFPRADFIVANYTSVGSTGAGTFQFLDLGPFVGLEFACSAGKQTP